MNMFFVVISVLLFSHGVFASSTPTDPREFMVEEVRARAHTASASVRLELSDLAAASTGQYLKIFGEDPLPGYLPRPLTRKSILRDERTRTFPQQKLDYHALVLPELLDTPERIKGVIIDCYGGAATISIHSGIRTYDDFLRQGYLVYILNAPGSAPDGTYTAAHYAEQASAWGVYTTIKNICYFAFAVKYAAHYLNFGSKTEIDSKYPTPMFAWRIPKETPIFLRGCSQGGYTTVMTALYCSMAGTEDHENPGRLLMDELFIRHPYIKSNNINLKGRQVFQGYIADCAALDPVLEVRQPLTASERIRSDIARGGNLDDSGVSAALMGLDRLADDGRHNNFIPEKLIRRFWEITPGAKLLNAPLMLTHGVKDDNVSVVRTLKVLSLFNGSNEPVYYSFSATGGHAYAPSEMVSRFMDVVRYQHLNGVRDVPSAMERHFPLPVEMIEMMALGVITTDTLIDALGIHGFTDDDIKALVKLRCSYVTSSPYLTI